MQMSAAKRRLSGLASTLMTSLGQRAQQGGCVCGAFDRNLKKNENSYLFIYFYFYFYFDPVGWQKFDRLQNSSKLYSTYLFVYYMNIQNVSSSRLYNLLESADVLWVRLSTCRQAFLTRLFYPLACVLLCSSAVLDPRVGHTMDLLSPFIPVLCKCSCKCRGDRCSQTLCSRWRANPKSNLTSFRKK